MSDLAAPPRVTMPAVARGRRRRAVRGLRPRGAAPPGRRRLGLRLRPGDLQRREPRRDGRLRARRPALQRRARWRGGPCSPHWGRRCSATSSTPSPSLPLAEEPFPSVADAFYLAYYLPLYVALVALIRARVPRFHPSMWLDGVIGALGAAAVGGRLRARPVAAPAPAATGRGRRQPGLPRRRRAAAGPAGGGRRHPRRCASTARCCSSPRRWSLRPRRRHRLPRPAASRAATSTAARWT